jgi:hypothetical protein
MAGANGVAASALVPLSLAVDGAWPAPWRAPLGWAVVFYAAGPITLGHLWFYQVVRRLGPRHRGRGADDDALRATSS